MDPRFHMAASFEILLLFLSIALLRPPWLCFMVMRAIAMNIWQGHPGSPVYILQVNYFNRKYFNKSPDFHSYWNYMCFHLFTDLTVLVEKLEDGDWSDLYYKLCTWCEGENWRMERWHMSSLPFLQPCAMRMRKGDFPLQRKQN